MNNFWNRTKLESTDCLVWLGYCDKDGYGRITIDGKSFRCHRIAWELAYGIIPNSLLVLHKCDNPSCLNPEHLFLGTISDNNKDCVFKGRASGNSSQHTSGAYATKLTSIQVQEIRKIKEISQKQIAKKFHISQAHVSDIRSFKSWR